MKFLQPNFYPYHGWDVTTPYRKTEIMMERRRSDEEKPFWRWFFD